MRYLQTYAVDQSALQYIGISSCVAVSVCDHFGLWPSRSVAVLVCGRFSLWPFRSVAVPVCARSGLWPFRFVTVSVCGRSGLWPFRLWPFRFVAVMTCYPLADAQLSRARIPMLARKDGIHDFDIWWFSVGLMIIEVSMVNIASLVYVFKMKKSMWLLLTTPYFYLDITCSISRWIFVIFQFPVRHSA